MHPERPRMPSQVTEHDFFRRNLIPTSTLPCKQQFQVPVAWHLIVSENGDGSVSDEKIQEQMKVLNGLLNIKNTKDSSILHAMYYVLILVIMIRVAKVIIKHVLT